MEARHLILTELAEMGSPLASLPFRMPFKVPEGYFRDFPETVAFLTGNALEEAPDPKLPFHKLPPAFAVPEGYFDQFPNALSEAIEAQDLEAKLPKGNPFEVPAGYFEHLAAATVAAVSGKEETPSFGRLALPMDVPAGYFEEFPARLQEKLAAPAPREIPLPAPAQRKNLVLPVLRWAAAAALIAGIFVGVERADAPNATPNTARRALASLPKSDLADYVSQNIEDFDPELIEGKAGSVAFPKTTPASGLAPSEIQQFLVEEGLL